MNINDNDRDASRLVITNMAFNNFKSFYGKKLIGDFHPKFTSVIGPNGSGKSNLIEALPFVFGYKASKMRQPKLTGMIHNSSKHTNLKECSVTINFAKVDDNNQIIPGTDFCIKRDVHSNNVNNYYLNNTKVNRSKVTELLRREGVDLDNNRFLIQQGEVQQISLMKPKATTQGGVGFLEYIEEIIGSNKYIEQINQLEAEILQKNQIRDVIAERVALSKRDRDALEGAKNEAQRFLDLQTKMKLVDAKRLFNNKSELEKEVKEAKKKVDEFKAELDEKKEKYENNEKESKEILDSIKQKEKELEKMKPELDKMQKILSNLKNDRTKLSTEIDGAERLIKDCKETEKKSTDEISASKSVILTKEEEKNKIKEKVDEVNVELEAAKKVLETQTEEVKVEIEHLQNCLEEAKKKYSSKNAEFLKLETDMTNSQNEIDSINRKVNDSQKMRSEKEKLLERSQQRISQLTVEIPEKEERLNNIKNELMQLQHQIQHDDDELKNLKQRSNDLAAVVHEMNRNFQKSQEKDKVIACIMEFKRRENVTGIYGKLGDLGTIEEKYDVAVSTAAGNKLNHIVVQTVQDAELCLNIVKEAHAGIVNCIVLDKMQKDNIRSVMESTPPKDTLLILQKIKMTDNASREKFLPAFYYAFRDTLIAPNMDVAKAVGYGSVRRRVVTMNGEIIDTSGIMSGGGSKKQSGGMSMVNEDELKAKKDELNILSNKCSQLSDIVNNANFRIRELQREQTELERDIKKLNMDFESESQVEANVKEQLSGMTDFVHSEKDLEEINKHQEFIEQNSQNFDETRNEVNKLRNDSQEIENKISGMINERTKEQRNKISQIETTLETHRKNIAKCESTAKAAQRKIDKLTKVIDDNKEMIENTEKEIEKNKATLEKTREKKAEKKAQVKTMAESVEKLDEEVKSHQEKIRESKNEVNKLKLKIEKMNTEFGKLHASAKAVKRELKNVNARFDKLGIGESDFHDLNEKTIEELEIQRVAIEAQLNELDPDLNAIHEYEEKQEIYKRNYDEFTQADTDRNNVLDLCNQRKQERFDMFMDGFQKISQKLKETYQILTLGGDAELEFADRFDPFSHGINFSVRPPGKSWKVISNLSGGEQTLSSLSLVFTLHQFKPSPFYILDEIDAALDFRNVSIIANYLKERTINAQLIVVSLRNYMFELADRLIGIYKVDDLASAITIDVEQSVDDAVTENGNANGENPATGGGSVGAFNESVDESVNDGEEGSVDNESSNASHEFNNEFNENDDADIDVDVDDDDEN